MLLATQSPSPWRLAQRKNFTDWKTLAHFLELDTSHYAKIVEIAHFPLNLPLRLAEKIEKNSFDDPILRQFLPIIEEGTQVEGFTIDPVGDLSARKGDKLLHKYEGRALLITTSACAMHCRYCFRRNFPYENQDKTFTEELEILQNDHSIKEIILSGGDPLSLSNELLRSLLTRLGEIPHITKIRFHSRFPIGIPERIDEEFLTLLAELPKQVIFIIHSNHPRELDEDVLGSLKKLQKLGIPILNQSVLLKGVNDSFETMKELLEKLIDNGILPYYLHQLDRAEGVSHFETSEEFGKDLLAQLAKVLPGYAIPRYVREIAGKNSKTPIF
ncbi:MAG: KamA family radical SAM protein [Chlamydiae bacterium]|nr:KamA family radical SAM protein [Chlamydiota bacterium]